MVRYTKLIEHIGEQNEKLAKQGFQLEELERRLKNVRRIIEKYGPELDLEKFDRIEQSLGDSKRESQEQEKEKVLNRNPFKKLKDRNTALMKYIDNQDAELVKQGIEINTLKQCLKDALRIIEDYGLESKLEEFDITLSNLE
jgi:uncharacterized iron-regulated protein